MQNSYGSGSGPTSTQSSTGLGARANNQFSGNNGFGNNQSSYGMAGPSVSNLNSKP
jgi:hypothetical protein